MKQATGFGLFLLRSVVTGLAIAFLIITFVPSLRERVMAPVANGPADSGAGIASLSFADAVDRAAPSVVSIYTRTEEYLEFAPQVQRRLGALGLRQTRQDMGSGVLVSEDGYILTNYHVVNAVQKIQVALWDGRFAEAQVVGSDPATDLAVLRIEIDGLPAAPLAEDTEVRVGDVVLAIGNALGLSHTVTMGIVSATGRNDLGPLLLADFIQTDAAINAGNSGGALINLRGEVIGINARNFGRVPGTESAQNIGFAIPIALARDVMRQIIDTGSVRRGWLGASFKDLSLSVQPDGSAVQRGVRVLTVDPRGPAWSAGLRSGDILIAIDGMPADDARAVMLAIAQRAPGEQVELVVQRQNDLFQAYATLIQQPPLR